LRFGYCPREGNGCTQAFRGSDHDGARCICYVRLSNRRHRRGHLWPPTLWWPPLVTGSHTGFLSKQSRLAQVAISVNLQPYFHQRAAGVALFCGCSFPTWVPVGLPCIKVSESISGHGGAFLLMKDHRAGRDRSCTYRTCFSWAILHAIIYMIKKDRALRKNNLQNPF